jgi:hypothetical protein
LLAQLQFVPGIVPLHSIEDLPQDVKAPTALRLKAGNLYKLSVIGFVTVTFRALIGNNPPILLGYNGKFHDYLFSRIEAISMLSCIN